MAGIYGACIDAPCCGCCGTNLYGGHDSFEPEYDPDAYLAAEDEEEEFEDVEDDFPMSLEYDEGEWADYQDEGAFASA